MNKKILLIIFAACVFLILIFVIIINNYRTTIISVDPKNSSILTPGSKATFTIKFNKAVDFTNLDIELTMKEITSKDGFIPVDINKYLSSDKTTLTIDTISKVLPLSIYELSINSNVLNATYYSSDVLPTPVANNNKVLKEYLPQNASNYQLIYNERLNEYEFSYVYDPKSKISPPEQYKKAVSDAENFIKSKGIDLKSVEINWSSH